MKHKQQETSQVSSAISKISHKMFDLVIPTFSLAVTTIKDVRDTDKEGDNQNMTTSEDNLPIYSLAEVSYHDTRDDCWIVLYDLIYNATTFLHEHPGGEEVILEYAGRDATLAFRGVGHSAAAIASLKPFLVGVLPQNQRICLRRHGESGGYCW